MQFNPEQMQALTFKDGPCLVLAGPGSGKTAVITGRLLQLIEKEGVDPSALLTITFTKAAALEMQSRFYKLSDSKYPEVCFGTFHSVFYQIIRQSLMKETPVFMKQRDAYRITEQVMKECGVKYSTESIRSFLSIMSAEKNGRAFDASLSLQGIGDKYTELTDKYERIRKDLQLMDFDDILPTCLELFRKSPAILKKWRERFKYVQTDEFQDVNDVQIEVLKELTAPVYNLFAVGDDDQAIYSFRGASPSAMLSFDSVFPNAQTIRLKTNYRSHPAIIAAATKVISVNTQRLSKESIAYRTEGEADHNKSPVLLHVFDDENEEKMALIQALKSRGTEQMSLSAQDKEDIHTQEEIKCSLSDTAILFRTNRQASDFALLLHQNRIPFYMREKMTTLMDLSQVQDMMAYFRAASGEVARHDFLRIMNRPVRFISREAASSPIMNRNVLQHYYERTPYMLQKVEKLFRDLELIGRLSPAGAIRFIRQGIGYDKYCKEQMNTEEYEKVRQILDRLEERAGMYTNLSEFMAALEDEQNRLEEMNEREPKEGAKEGVRLMTLHASKGLEFETVFMPFLNEGLIPSRQAVTKELREEERRLFYVGMTRARDRLFMSCVKNNRKSISSFLMPVFGQIPKKTYKAKHLC